MLAGEVSLKLVLRREDVHAVVAMKSRGQADVVTAEMLSNARAKLPDLLAALRTFVGMIFQEVLRHVVQRFAADVAQTTVSARHSGRRRFVLVEDIFDEGQHVAAKRFDGGCCLSWCDLIFVFT